MSEPLLFALIVVLAGHLWYLRIIADGISWLADFEKWDHEMPAVKQGTPNQEQTP